MNTCIYALHLHLLQSIMNISNIFGMKMHCFKAFTPSVCKKKHFDKQINNIPKGGLMTLM